MERIAYFFIDVVLPVMWFGAIIIYTIFYIAWRMGKVKITFKNKQNP